MWSNTYLILRSAPKQRVSKDAQLVQGYEALLTRSKKGRNRCAVSTFTAPTVAPVSNRSSMPPGSRPNTISGSAVDDSQVYHHTQDQTRLRRRSMHTLDSADYPNPLTPHLFKRVEEANRLAAAPNGAGRDMSKPARLSPNPAHQNNMHNRNNSSESVASSRSSRSRPSVSTMACPLAPAVVSCRNLSFGGPVLAHGRAQQNNSLL